jgi:hypothetical protein
VLRVQTERTDYYFKALPAVYAAEPRLVQQLASWQPGRVPDVVAVEPDEHWLLTRNCPGQSLELGASLAAWERAAAAYAELQIAASQHLPGLRALGCRQRDPLALQALIAPLLADTPALQLDAEHGLDAVELRRLRELGPCLEAACLELGAIGELPLSLEHGDLWGSNVYASDDQVAFIDWTDASLAHPFFSLTPLLQSARWAFEGVEDAEQRIVDAYLAPWTACAPPDTLHRAMALARPLAAVHIAATYWRDVPQPHRQWWMPRAVPFFLRLALAEWSATR